MNLYTKSAIFLIILFSSILSGFTQNYNIRFKINGLENGKIIIAHHYGNNNLINDTVRLDENGVGAFTGNDTLPHGMYICIFPSKKYFEFIVNADQKFKLSTDSAGTAENFVNHLEVDGSKINRIFKDYQLFMIEKTKESQELRKKLSQTKNKEIEEQLKGLNDEVKAYWDTIQKEHPGTFIDIMLKALQEVEVPDPPKDEKGNITDSMFQYNYYKNHYFDNVHFEDTRLLYSPIYHRKLDFYFSKVVIRRPDSAINATDQLLEKLSEYPEYFKYTLSFIFNKYAKTKYMGFDRVIVHLAENYYLAGKAEWASDEFLEKLGERVVKIKPNMVGEKAPRLDKAQTIEGYFYPLHDIDAKYTVIAFWEPNCGHCKDEVPALYELWKEYHNKGLEVYAFYTQNDKEEWEKFINDKGVTDWINVYDPNYFTRFRSKFDVYSTPTLYLLDENKVIEAKRIDINTLKQILKEKVGE